jgi:D-apiose dehydrogenase
MRGCLVGCGFFGQIHLEAWRRIESVSIVGTCDTDPTKATHQHLDAMLDELQPDFLDITTRPELHLEMVRAAVERRIPAICQKPMAPTWTDAVAMVELAEAAGVPLVIHENWRWQPWYRVVAEELAKGLIGEPVTYTFRTRKLDGNGADAYNAQPYFRSYPRLLLYETLVHHLDTARFLFGEIDSVFAQARRVNPSIEGEDQVLLLTRHASGLGGVLDGHRFVDLRADSPPLGDFTVDGIGASLVVDASGDVWLWNGRERKLIWQNTVGQGYRGDSVRAVCRHFVEELAGERRFESTGREYLRTVACVEAGYRSMSSGRAESTVA